MLILSDSFFIMTKLFDKEAFLKEFHDVTKQAENSQRPTQRVFDDKVLIEILDNRRPLKEYQVELFNLVSLEKGKGHAGKAVRTLMKLADKYNIGIVVDAAPSDREDGSLTRYQLFKFYKARGFWGISSCPEMYRPSSMDRKAIQPSLRAAISP
jgi:hypothetical protein